MLKQEFLTQLRNALSGLPAKEAEERVAFYAEMISDRMEEGLSEEEAVSAVGSIGQILDQVLADTPQTKTAAETAAPKKQLRTWEILLLALGAPLWLSLGIAAVSIVFSVYISLWSVVISLWAVFGSLIACAVGLVIAGAVFAIGGNGPSGIATIAAGMICAGLSVFAFYGSKAASAGLVNLTKKAALWIKGCFTKKEG